MSDIDGFIHLENFQPIEQLELIVDLNRHMGKKKGNNFFFVFTFIFINNIIMK
jgi:hypothetical protein